ncbi:MAG: hypothetical protein PUK40_00580 [Actinomycetaceae bacterium]|nr:hypothetical protein [Arcanobacterium sp.]MDD7504436.1 hypothetical protein [Actinomycetaceae bacterium]MDY6143380.1 hypothetical protein [Arcanobacterium sp.]
MRSSLVKGIASLSAVLMLGACSSEIPVPEPKAGQYEAPIVPEARFAKITSEASTTLAAADEAKDADQLAERFEDPFVHDRRARYQLSKVMGDAYTLPSVELDSELNVIHAGSGFPRTAMTLAEPTESSNLRQLTIWSQDNPRVNYKVWAQVPIFADASAPALKQTFSNDAGHTAAKEGTYSGEPAQIMAAYAQYQQDREQGDIAFSADDPLYTQLGSFVDSLKSNVGDFGEVKIAFSAPENAYRGVSTEDGGLLLVSQLLYTVTVTKTNEDATIELGGEIGALASGESDGVLEVGDTEAVAHYSSVVAFYVPPSGADDQTVKVLGASVPALFQIDK